jgi:hypothetical protein
MVDTIQVEGTTYQVLDDGKWKCDCGYVVKQKKTLTTHIHTKSHETNKLYRQHKGNTTIFVSLLTPGLMVHR